MDFFPPHFGVILFHVIVYVVAFGGGLFLCAAMDKPKSARLNALRFVAGGALLAYGYAFFIADMLTWAG